MTWHGALFLKCFSNYTICILSIDILKKLNRHCEHAKMLEPLGYLGTVKNFKNPREFIGSYVDKTLNYDRIVYID